MCSRVILLNKPYDVLCQFTDGFGHTGSGHTDSDDSPGRKTLSRYVKQPGYYPAGRLDRDSEGLVVLTNDGRLQHRISHPRYKQPKTYFVQVDGDITAKALDELCRGITLKDGPAVAISVRRTNSPSWLWPRNPPIRVRKAIPTSWIILVIREGRNRQVRRMTAAVGHPTLRLIRYSVGNWCLDNLAPGQWRYASADLPGARSG